MVAWDHVLTWAPPCDCHGYRGPPWRPLLPRDTGIGDGVTSSGQHSSESITGDCSTSLMQHSGEGSVGVCTVDNHTLRLIGNKGNT